MPLNRKVTRTRRFIPYSYLAIFLPDAPVTLLPRLQAIHFATLDASPHVS